MTDQAATPVSEVLEAADAYLRFLSHYRHGDEGPADINELAGPPEARRLFQLLEGQPHEVQEMIVDRLASGLTALPDPLAASVVAIHLGSIIEEGVNPVPLARAMNTRLPNDFAAARAFVELVTAETGVAYPNDVDRKTLNQLGQRHRVGASAWAGLQFSTMAAMAAWCRHRPTRLAARTSPTLTNDAVFLGSRGGYCWYIGELLTAADGIELTVLAPEQQKGFVVELEAVRNAAHLFALLEDTLVGDESKGLLTGPRTNPQVAAVARGVAGIPEGISFTIGWHYEYWYALKPERAAQLLGLHPLAASMIGVEVIIPEIPEFQGQQIIFMRPGQFGSRQCDLNFFAPLHDALRSQVTILQHLPPTEVDSMCERLRAAAENFG